MKLTYRVYLVHNPFDPLEGVTYLSGIIRTGTNSHWNHIAIELDIEGECWILEAIGEGVILRPLEEWQQKATREVLVRRPIGEHHIDLQAVLQELGESYGYLDLAHILKYIIKRRWDTSYEWDGEARWEGWFCSELAAYLEGRETPWLWLPCDYEHVADLEDSERFLTLKGVGVVEDEREALKKVA